MVQRDVSSLLSNKKWQSMDMELVSKGSHCNAFIMSRSAYSIACRNGCGISRTLGRKTTQPNGTRVINILPNFFCARKRGRNAPPIRPWLDNVARHLLHSLTLALLYVMPLCDHLLATILRKTTTFEHRSLRLLRKTRP